MKVLVAYMSLTGNTKKVAEVIYDEISAEKDIKRMEDVESLDGFDFAFLGFPMHNFGPDATAKNHLERLVMGRRIALFITHMAPEGGPVLEGWVQKFKDAAAGANIIGVFDCQGQASQQVLTAMLNHPSPDIRRWVQADSSRGQPDASRLERARAFARETIKKLQ